MKIKLGEEFKVDLDVLLTTRALVQANSGAGKSWMLRKLIEESHGHVQQIILDVEGDFSSLREKFDFVLAGKGGDIPAQVKSAELLARKILELKSDLIVDLYELKAHERIKFVELFLNSMVNAPKNLWQPVLVVLDEAHIFAPEKGNASSMGAVIDIATRGRKRGYCLVMATQRLSKLHKDAAAECNNKIIGRTGLDIDVKRAADELGISAKESTQVLRKLSPGQFFAYGPAICNEVTSYIVGPVQTRHPKAGKIGVKHAPAPSSKTKKVLDQLKDLPEEAEADINDREALKKRIKDLEAMSALHKMQAHSTYGRFGDSKSKKEFETEIARVRKELESHIMGKFNDLKNKLNAVLADFSHVPKELRTMKVQSIYPSQEKIINHLKGNIAQNRHIDKAMREHSTISVLGACEKKILGFLAVRNDHAFSKVQIGAMTGYAHSSGGFNNAISRLSQHGFIQRQAGQIQITRDGSAEALTFSTTLPTLKDWIDKLGACERKIYEHVLANPGTMFDKIRLAEVTGYAAGSGGFNNAISRLNTLGLIHRESGHIQLNPEIQI